MSSLTISLKVKTVWMFSRLQMCRYTNSTYLQLLRCHTVKYIIIILLKIAMRKGILVRAHNLHSQCLFVIYLVDSAFS